MTRPLADWLDWKVQYKGYITNWETLPSGQRRFFFETVQIKPWVHLHGEHRPRQIDHLWVYLDDLPIPVSNKRQMKRFDQMIGSAIIKQYRRKNGLLDYGVDHQAAIHLDKALQNLKQSKFKSFRDAEEVCGELIDAIDRGTVLIPFGEDPTKRREKLVALQTFYTSQKETEARYEQIKRQNALKPRPNSNILLFPKREKKPATGFTRI